MLMITQSKLYGNLIVLEIDIQLIAAAFEHSVGSIIMVIANRPHYKPNAAAINCGKSIIIMTPYTIV